MYSKPFSPSALVCCYGQKVFIKDWWYAATEKVQKWHAETKRLGTLGAEQHRKTKVMSRKQSFSDMSLRRIDLEQYNTTIKDKLVIIQDINIY